jgi:hypothetical protein
MGIQSLLFCHCLYSKINCRSPISLNAHSCCSPKGLFWQGTGTGTGTEKVVKLLSIKDLNHISKKITEFGWAGRVPGLRYVGHRFEKKCPVRSENEQQFVERETCWDTVTSNPPTSAAPYLAQ